MEISAIERGMEQRRERITTNLNGARLELENGARWLPLFGVAALAIVGFSAGRNKDRPARTRERRGLSWGSVAATLAGVIRFAGSPALAPFWRAVGRARTARPR